jgi:hypothetical protein
VLRPTAVEYARRVPVDVANARVLSPTAVKSASTVEEKVPVAALTKLIAAVIVDRSI